MGTEIQDQWGSIITVAVIPGTAAHPELVQVTTRDPGITIVEMSLEQTRALINALTDAIGGTY